MTTTIRYEDAGDIDLDEEVVRRRDGTRVTEADAEEQGRRIAARKRGRPSISGETRSPQVSARVSTHTRDAIKRKAEAEGKRLSDVVREAIEHYLSNP